MVGWPSLQTAISFAAAVTRSVTNLARQVSDRVASVFNASRPPIYYIHYAVAAFSVLAVALGLYFSWHSGDVLRKTVGSNYAWHQLHEHVATLRGSVGKLYEPAKSVFKSRSPWSERVGLEKAADDLQSALAAVRKSSVSLLPNDSRKDVFRTIDYLELTASNIVVRTRVLLGLYRAGDTDEATLQMALTDRHYNKSLKYIDSISEQLHAVKTDIYTKNVEQSAHLRTAEIILAIILMAMVVCTSVYGHFVGAMIERKFSEVEELNANLEQQGAELMHQNLRLDETLRQLPHGVSWFDSDDRMVVCNELYRELFGLPEHLTKPGTPHSEILDYQCGVPGTSNCYAEAMRSETTDEEDETQPWQRNAKLADGRAIAVAHIPMPEGGCLRTFTDITEKAKLEQKIAHQARHDALTGLLNRYGFNQEVERVLALMNRGQAFSVVYLDLDHFKQVNDTLGHPIGDGLLQQVAARLRSCVRETDVVARIGGDEFAIIQVLSDQPRAAKILAERLIAEVSEPYDVEGHQITVGTSIGIVVAPEDGTAMDTLLKNADLALYRAKGDGRGVYKFFEPEMDAKMQARRRLELDLRQALDQEEFELHYQPLVETSGGQIRAFEALLRWNHPQRGMVSPMDFIPLAEEVGLMGKIGAWVFKQACKDAASWPDKVGIAVNVSPVQFRDQSIELNIVDALSKSGLAAERLEIEITESVLLENIEKTQETLLRIRNLGVKIALDDFGTGYSSLSYLKDFPFDKVKIDRSFIQASNQKSGGALAIIRAIVGMSSSLGMGTTAEGIETVEQLEKLTAEGCSELQGFLFGKPMPAEQVSDAILNHRGEKNEDMAACA